ncbi:hypothetical protein [uncultured Nevskia sp.]|uniref:hypothetical protein n=1 Tax=uncultured Nevskia sp. TaxID=228950 RepID=UPI0025F84DF0|nr:hypothetical protein [uncultured Nevskia sp.]
MTSIISSLLNLALHLPMLSVFKMTCVGTYEREQNALRLNAGIGLGTLMRIKPFGCARNRALDCSGQGGLR